VRPPHAASVAATGVIQAAFAASGHERGLRFTEAPYGKGTPLLLLSPMGCPAWLVCTMVDPGIPLNDSE
jgi:hypothetical protein